MHGNMHWSAHDRVAASRTYTRKLDYIGREVRYNDGQKCYSHQQSLCAAVSVWHHPNRSEEVARSAGNGEVLPDPATVVL